MKYLIYLSLVFSVLLISACGGGSGSSPSDASDPIGIEQSADSQSDNGGDSIGDPTEGNTSQPSFTGEVFDWGQDNGFQAPEYFNGFALTSISTFEEGEPEGSTDITFTNNIGENTISVNRVGFGEFTMALDSSSRLTSSDTRSQYFYNGAGLISSILQPGVSPSGPEGAVGEFFFYDQNRMLVRYSSQFQNTTYSYFENGSPAGSNGGCTFVTDNNNRITTRLCSTSRTEIDYDSSGNPTDVRVFELSGDLIESHSLMYEPAASFMNLGLVSFVEIDFFQLRL